MQRAFYAANGELRDRLLSLWRSVSETIVIGLLLMGVNMGPAQSGDFPGHQTPDLALILALTAGICFSVGSPVVIVLFDVQDDPLLGHRMQSDGLGFMSAVTGYRSGSCWGVWAGIKGEELPDRRPSEWAVWDPFMRPWRHHWRGSETGYQK